MRKWMRERLKRRKEQTPAEKTTQEPGQEPLRPAYFDAAETEAPTPASPPETEPEPQEESAPAAADESAAEPAQAAAPGGPDRTRRRRRRGRGGRGRGQAQPQTPLQPTLMREKDAAPPVSDAPSEAATARPTPATPQKPKGVVVLAIGLPGSGKSSWFKRHDIRPLSSDLLRDLLFDDPTEQRFQDLVFSNLRRPS